VRRSLGGLVRARLSERCERGRIQLPPALFSSRGDNWGAFDLLDNARPGTMFRIIATTGSDEIPWEHVSVSTRTRCPTWDEMCWVKGLFFEDEEAVVQYHPKKSDYVSYHAFCLHLWRPLVDLLPLPPRLAVGPKTPEEIDDMHDRFAAIGVRLRGAP
jgi:hypothetical protein